MVYFARLIQESDDCYAVEFPDIEFCVTEGNSKEHALAMAKEVLNLYLIHTPEVNAPQVYAGEDIYPIEVEATTLAVMRMRAVRQEADLTQAHIAQRLGISQQAYQKMESGKEDLKLSTLERIAKAYERPLSYFVS